MGLDFGVLQFLKEAREDLVELIRFEKEKCLPSDKLLDEYELKIKQIDEMLK